MSDTLTKASQYIGLAKQTMAPFEGRKGAVLSTAVIMTMIRKVKAYLIDAEKVLLTENGAAGKESKAPSADPSATPKVVLNEQGGFCPVCEDTKGLILMVVQDKEGTKATLQTQVCLDCLQTHKSAALHGKSLKATTPPEASPTPPDVFIVSPTHVKDPFDPETPSEPVTVLNHVPVSTEAPKEAP